MLAQAHGGPGSVRQGRSPVVPHPNASHGPPPPYDAGHEPVSGSRHRMSLRPLLARRTRAMHDFLARQADLGAQPWARLWREGHGDVWDADARYIGQREAQWRRALLR